MSRIDELIAEHCPDGVEFSLLASLGKRNKGTPITAAKMKTLALTPGPIRIFAGGQTIADVSEDAIPSKNVIRVPSIIIKSRGHIGVTYYEKPFTHKSELWSYSIDHPDVDQKFVYYYLLTQIPKLQEVARATSVKLPQLGVKDTDLLKVPVPPLEVQRAIVEVLDKFSKLEAELEAELEARKQQYEHYRAELLAKAAELGRLVELGELGRIVTGRTPKSSDASAWGDHLDFVTPSDIKNGMKWIRTPARRLSASGSEVLSKAIVPQGSLLVTCIGADMGKTVLNGNPCATNQQINSLTLDPGVDTNFVFHVLTSMRDKIRAQGERAGGTMPIINKSDFSKIRIALPSFEEQQRIASILDQFDALVNDLSVGLPAELAARRQQYEYYRDKLLTFKELEVAS